MESLQQERQPPPSYSSHDPESLELPSVPRQEVGSPPSNAQPINLPHLRSLGLPEHNLGSHTTSPPPDSKTQQWQSGYNVMPSSFPPVPHVAPRSDASIGSPMEISGTMGLEEQNNISHSVSMDDPDVRMAAEALSGLGNPDYARSPATRSTTLSAHPASTRSASTIRPTSQPPSDSEPLLALLTSSHPWLGATVNGSLYAYGGAKHYSPRFVRGTAEFVERNIGSPMANTVGYVSRQTGVDGRIRRYLGDRRMSDEAKNGSGSKRRRVMRGVASPNHKEMEDVEQGLQGVGDVTMSSPKSDTHSHRMRTSSQSSMSAVESLPAYDDNRSPRYEELSPLLVAEKPLNGEPSPREQEQQQQRNWPGQLLMTTSGLGVALSDSSLRSLKFSLSVLRGAIDQIGNVMRALKSLLEEFNSSHSPDQSSSNEKAPATGQSQNRGRQASQKNQERSRRLAEGIKSLSDSLWSTLRQTINTISQYTGSALPDNAASLVRRQLMSLPQRWRVAANSSGSQNGSASSGEPMVSPGVTGEHSEGQAVLAANRMLAFGQETLEMFSQVNLVVSGTIESAEQWLDSLGRRRENGSDGPRASTSVNSAPITNGDGSQGQFVAGQVWTGDQKERR